MKSAFDDCWIKTSQEGWALFLEASAVIRMRLLKTALGNDIGGTERQMMVTEKLHAAQTLPFAMPGTSILANSNAMIVHYRKCVSANYARLTEEC